MTKDYPNLFINGEWVPPISGGVTPVINPATEEVIGSAPNGTRADVVRAIDAARVAFDEGPWPRMAMQERALVMVRMADLMEKRFEELVNLNIAESGGTRMLAESVQIGFPIQHFRDMAQRVMPAFQMTKPIAPHVAAGMEQGVIRREAWGVAALISAYNFPFFLNIMKIAPALASGCTSSSSRHPQRRCRHL